MEKKGIREKKWLKIFIIVSVVIAILFVAVVLIINPSARNLGVVWNEEDVQTANAKLMRQRVELPDTNNPLESLKYEGSHPIDISLTSEELTAMINTRNHKYNPLKNVQIRVNEDGTTEMSGVVLLGNIIPYTEALGIENSDIKNAISEFGEKIPMNPTFYLKITPKIVNNVADVKMEEIKIGAFDIGDHLKGSDINSLINQQISGVPGLNVENLKTNNGKLDFKGSYPDKSYYSPN